ncbi:hypothetical protein BJV85_000217 [Clostridium acetobutylicum]|uniref:Uncharacterized protein n=1 Tax=Clostridium acetobutylicum TaxID=1488 RepID=O32325_CLOAT|nr:hypothetical protein [Clostridium acetobutylicum ATCC 824]NOV87246.1 hypothetical protein [Clostridium acetobutylicum]NOW14408.1 hypothetical protein [Clostridium acetobutylicum]NRY58423.1 hypothetical protein [Clostridium acetobutylicum]NSA91371.1 hypothetical protein [Clostridium acetobutylicum]
MLDVIFLVLIVLGFLFLRYFINWCEGTINKK